MLNDLLALLLGINTKEGSGCCYWKPSKSAYTVSSFMKLMVQPVENYKENFSNCLKMLAPHRIQFFYWLLCHGKIPFFVCRKIIPEDQLLFLFCNGIETQDHIILLCARATRSGTIYSGCLVIVGFCHRLLLICPLLGTPWSLVGLQ